MKKALFSCLAAALCLSAYAGETAKVTIELLSTNATYGTDVLELRENTERNSTYESGYDSESMMSQANKHSVLLYGFVGDRPCSYVATDNLNGLAIGFTTNKYDESYTLSFSNVSGRSLTLYDRILDVETDITEGGHYDFTVEDAQVGRVAINDRFFINLDASSFASSVTTNEYGWASFSYEGEDVHPLNESLKIYAGELSGDVLNLNEVDYVAGNEGVIVYGTPNTTYFFTAGTLNHGEAYMNNQLKASYLWESRSGEIFCLKGDALYQYTGSSFPTNKAFLEIPVGPTPAPRRVSIRVNNAPTAVENVEAGVKVEKVMENGQIFILRGENVYNLQGQLVR